MPHSPPVIPRNARPRDSLTCGRGSFLTALALVGALVVGWADSLAAEASAVLREAATLRALAIEAPAAVRSQLDGMPNGAMGREAEGSRRRQLAWALFFGGTLLKLGQTASPTPLALHYNPILDVGVLQACRLDAGGKELRCNELCAFPGETLAGLPARVQPQWLEDADPFTALSRNASVGVAAFARQRPAGAKVGPSWRTQYCSPANQQIAELRLMQGLLSASKVDPRALDAAVKQWVQQSEPGSTPELRGLLSNLTALNFSGAVKAADSGWYLAFTPKRTGWRQVLLVIESSAGGALRLAAVRVVSIAAEN